MDNLTTRRPFGCSIPFQPQERFSAVSHLLGGGAALMGTAALVAHSRGAALVVVSLVYGLSMTLMFCASALYHAFKTEEAGDGFWRRLDHVAIFFMIAGSYTPICYVYLDGLWRWGVLGLVWGLVLVGLLFKLLFIGAPRAVGAAIYLVMGWTVIIPHRQLLQALPGRELELIVLGGAAYSVGAVVYALKRPDPLPGRFGFHEVFHVLVLVGAAIHYAAMYAAVG